MQCEICGAHWTDENQAMSCCSTSCASDGSKAPALTVVVTCLDQPDIGTPREASGWGDDATETAVRGAVQEITISREGESQIGIRIMDTGEIVITDFGHLCYEMDVPRNVRFVPARPWESP